MSKPRIARRQIAAAHLSSSDRGARLLAACNGDADHAERVAAVLEGRDERPLAPVVHLPRPYDYACTVDESAGLAELELEPRRVEPPLRSWLLAAVLGVGAWIVFAGVAWACYAIVQALT